MEQQDKEGDYISKSFFGSIMWRIKKVTAPLLRQKSELINIDEEDLEFLERKLERIRSTLKDCANLETSYDSVKLWVRELKQLEACIEDILEELQFELMWKPRMQRLRSQLRKSTSTDVIAGKRKRDEISFLFSSRPGKSLHHKVGKIINLYNEIASDSVALRLREGDGVMIRPHHRPRTESTSHPAEKFSSFHGRTSEFGTVMTFLFSEAAQERDMSVTAIVGMAGVGKTALAQHVFSNEKVRRHFNERIWICMSEGLNAEKVTRNIRDSLVKEYCGPERSLDLLQKDIIEKLRGKRFLLVLDDLWNEEFWRNYWEVIQTPLMVGAKGSGVIVTTRDRRVINNGEIVHLRCLSDSECWLIFQHHAFNGDQKVHPEFQQKIGNEINKKCEGLPLAAKVVGHHLHRLNIESNEEWWKRMLQIDDLCCPDELEMEILPVLELSYQRLPAHLKRCFPYCSLFPKSYTFEKDQLVRLWMAQGFVETKEGSKLEETGIKYFEELVASSLFQFEPKEQRYVMHYLFQKLAQHVASHECLKTENHKLEVHKKTLHSSLVLNDIHVEKGIKFDITDGKDLRSLLLISRHGYTSGTPFHVKIPVDLCINLQCLRALDLSDTDIEELPVSIGNLIHLRYLGLRNTKIKRLPGSIYCLFKLQTLDLRNCLIPEDLKEGITILSNLQDDFFKRNLNAQFTSKIYLLTGHQISPISSKINLIGCSGGKGKSKDAVNLTGDLLNTELKALVDGKESEGRLIKRLVDNSPECDGAMLEIQLQYLPRDSHMPI